MRVGTDVSLTLNNNNNNNNNKNSRYIIVFMKSALLFRLEAAESSLRSHTVTFVRFVLIIARFVTKILYAFLISLFNPPGFYSLKILVKEYRLRCMNMQLRLRLFSETDSDIFVLGTEIKSSNLQKQQSSTQNYIKIHYNGTS
jgi:hypothetical protein